MKTIKKRVGILTGAGISAESGLATFRDNHGLWENYNVEDVATPQGWQKDIGLVLEFYNKRREEVMSAEPNAAHIAIAELEHHFDVSVITQNVDDLHERADSKNVLHVHGEIMKSRSTGTGKIYPTINGLINKGDTCEEGYQLRPHVVWFGEDIFYNAEVISIIKQTDIVLVIGTSLSVHPFSSLLEKARYRAVKIIINKDLPEKLPRGYKFIDGNAADLVPIICRKIINGALGC